MTKTIRYITLNYPPAFPPYLFRKYLCKTRAPLNHAVFPALQPATRQQNHINHLDSVSNREQHLVQRIYQKNRNPFRLSPLRVISHIRVGIPPDLPKSKTSFRLAAIATFAIFVKTTQPMKLHRTGVLCLLAAALFAMSCVAVPPGHSRPHPPHHKEAPHHPPGHHKPPKPHKKPKKPKGPPAPPPYDYGNRR